MEINRLKQGASSGGVILSEPLFTGAKDLSWPTPFSREVPG